MTDPADRIRQFEQDVRVLASAIAISVVEVLLEAAQSTKFGDHLCVEPRTGWRPSSKRRTYSATGKPYEAAFAAIASRFRRAWSTNSRPSQSLLMTGS